MNTEAQTAANKLQRTRLRTIARRLLLGICWFNGIAAPICGALMILSPQGEIMHMQELLVTMQTWPGAEIFFQDLTWSGVALLCVNGVPNLVCLTLWFNKLKSYSAIGIVCGLLLIAWCIWEMIFIPNGVTILYLVLGIIQTVAAVYCTATRPT